MAKVQKVLIINAETGEEELRDMNAEELAQWELDKEKEAEKEAQKSAIQTEKQAVLTKLGLTAEEAAALLA
jgi:hypothetical protein